MSHSLLLFLDLLRSNCLSLLVNSSFAVLSMLYLAFILCEADQNSDRCDVSKYLAELRTSEGKVPSSHFALGIR